jgi:hypothetical protein
MLEMVLVVVKLMMKMMIMMMMMMVTDHQLSCQPRQDCSLWAASAAGVARADLRQLTHISPPVSYILHTSVYVCVRLHLLLSGSFWLSC